jgi:hypothetical protein
MIIPFFLAVLLAFPVPPVGATLGTSQQAPEPTPAVMEKEQVVQETLFPATGLATYYNPGVFEIVLKTRGLSPDGCPECVGYAAMLWEEDMGKTVCVDGYGPLWVVDVAAPQHRAARIAQGWIIDVDPDTFHQEMGWPNAPTMTTVEDC